jgi:type I restriction enzyme M protein
MIASLKPAGRMAIVLDSGSVSRGSGSAEASREQDIRRAFVERDLIEAIILLPDNIFYDTTSPGIVMILNRIKQHSGEILLINASRLFVNGRPKNELAADHVSQVHQLFLNWESIEQQAAVVTNEQVADNDYNLSPGLYITTSVVGELERLSELHSNGALTDQEFASLKEKLIADL